MTPQNSKTLALPEGVITTDTIKILYFLGYADPNDWSDPIPTEKPDQWMLILTKTLLME